jgi:hypothetical protein
MRVIRRNQNVLKVRPAPSVGLFVLALSFLGIGVVSLFIFGRTVALVCKRPTVERIRCRLQESLFGVPLKDAPLAALSGATVQSYVDSEGVALYRAVRLDGVKTARYPLREIVGVGLGRAPNNTQGEAYRVELVLSSGRRIPLIQSYSSGLSKKEKAVKLLRDYLEL